MHTQPPRVAQILNFSIAYGKTPVGLSKDFGVPVSEAKETVEKWYQDRPEARARVCARVRCVHAPSHS